MIHSISASTAVSPSSTVRDYIALMKPRVMSLVIFTAVCGLACAPGSEQVHPFLAGVIVLAIALGAGAAAVLNMWYDRDIDALMIRTQQRPLPMGYVDPAEALNLGIILSGISVMLLGLAANWCAAALLAFTIFYYAVIYTMLLKRHTPQNIVIGGVAGALPPVIAWWSVAPLDWLPWIMFAIIFWWTCPHFWALCLCTADDYARARVPMLPLSHGVKHTKIHMWVYTILTVFTVALPWIWGIFGDMYGWGSTLLGIVFVGFMARAWYNHQKRYYGQLFAYSILYLFAIFGLMVVDIRLG